ncbi:MAG: crossover junction endodeoxyribonuclease RuvC [Alphaproteobacteria bacterium CG_4_9_14_3_um_filter_47_13]|nr:MAG: crossover junction endodeoxyribonuclease RuvC [Alphaproteobacteria bacterium CG_4_9_14_3_um_filter_47_13]
MRILGIDPGLQKTGWGLIESRGNRLTFIGCGMVKTQTSLPLYARLAMLDDGLGRIIREWNPDIAAVEETFMNNNAASALKLGQARGVCMVAPARMGLEVYEYAANLVKKSIVGTGHATKDQIGMMIKILLPQSGSPKEDEADALAVAICHAHHAPAKQRITG